MLVGREGECARLDGLIADARRGRSSALVVRGPAGIGKSALLAYAGGRAGRTALRGTCGVESEVELGFSSLFDLVRPDLTRIEELPAAQAAALAGALSLGPAVPGSRYAVAAATLMLLATVAEAGGLVVTVDDAQWLDAPTAEALAFAARRLDAEGVLLLFAVRDGEPSALDGSGLPELRVAGLGRKAAHALLLQQGPIASDVAERLVQAIAGNPLALREVPSMIPAAVLAGREPLDEPLPVSRAVEAAFAHRVVGLPPATRWCLLLAAASETPSLVILAAATGTVGGGLAALGAAERVGLVTVDGGRVVFAHPLLRSVIYHGAGSHERRRAHRALADAVPPGAVERRAWHLGRAAAGPDEAIAGGLEEAAVAARAVAGPGAGARAFARAAELTPDPDERARRRIEAARDLQTSGCVDDSSALLGLALADTDDPALRADADLLRARLQVWGGEPGRAFASLRATAAGVAVDDPARAAALLTDAAVVATMRGDYAAQVATAHAAVAAAQRAGSDAAVAAAEVVLAHGLVNTGSGAEGEALLRRREAHLGDGTPVDAAALLQLAGFTWMCLEDDAAARRHLDVAIGSLRDAGAFGTLPFLLASRSMLDHRTGRWAAAGAGAWEAVRLAEETGHLGELPFHLVCLAAIEAPQGRVRDCRAHLATAAELVERFGVDSVRPWMEAALGALELGQGRYGEAVAALERIPPLVARMAIGQPTLVLWLPDLVETYARSGRRADAGEALEELEGQAEASGRIWARATAARCRGLLAPSGKADQHFRAALEWHGRSPAPFEVARTNLCYGERLGLERRRTEARGPLVSALDAFSRLGAEPWTARARAELARNGGRVRGHTDPGLDRLTPQELQVALVVAEGAANKEAAAALFLSPKTVEFHLGNAYRKLGVRSRTELTRLVTG